MYDIARLGTEVLPQVHWSARVGRGDRVARRERRNRLQLDRLRGREQVTVHRYARSCRDWRWP